MKRYIVLSALLILFPASRAAAIFCCLSYPNDNATYKTNVAINPPNQPTIAGAAVSYSVTPPLPAGIAFNSTTGVISGTPTAQAAVANYTVTARDSSGGTAATTLSIRVTAGTAAILSKRLSGAIALQIPGSKRIVFDLPGGTNLIIFIMDLNGKIVWSKTVGDTHDLAWDGLASNGHPAAKGIYFVRVTGLDLKQRPVGVAAKAFVYMP